MTESKWPPEPNPKPKKPKILPSREFQLVGTFAGVRDPIIRKYAEKGSAVRLFRDLNNPHDENAVSVWLWIEEGAEGRLPAYELIGYLGRDQAKIVSSDLDKGLEYHAKISNLWIPDRVRGPDVRIRLTKQFYPEPDTRKTRPFSPSQHQRLSPANMPEQVIPDKKGGSAHQKKEVEHQYGSGLSAAQWVILVAFIWFVWVLAT